MHFNEEPIVILTVEVEGEPDEEVTSEASVAVIPLWAMTAGSGIVSDPTVIKAEGNLIREDYIEDLGSNFKVSACLKELELEAAVHDFGLPEEFEYKLPREGEMAYTSLPEYITVYLHMLRAGFRILPLSFQLAFLKE